MLDGSRKQFQLGLIYLFGCMATFGVLPFSILRFVEGEYIKAAVDLVIVFAAAANALYALHTRKVFAPSVIAAILYSLAVIVVIYLNTPLYVFWLFPAVSANFFLLGTRTAIAVNVLLVAAILPLAMRLEDHIAGIGMIMSILFAAGMTFVFARLAREQQAMLETFATQDALTNLGNRRLMNVEIRCCIDDFKRAQLPSTIIVIDLDNFKLINDRFGHNVGDDLLVKIAELLRSRVRKTDRLFRFGGEEFVVLARNTSLTAANIIAEDLRKHIALLISSPSGSVTASFGCAELNPNDDANQWFARADQAMYRAKEQGRNCVALAA